MKAVVTGCCGFIGSTLTLRLLSDGWDVVGIDQMTPYYALEEKFANLQSLEAHSGFSFVHAELRQRVILPALDGADVVFHQAAQAGVRASWADFDEYVRCNISATYNLLEACRKSGARLSRIVYASSSSVYGDAAYYPVVEDSPTHPRSPYGTTKLAAEKLMVAYAESWGLPTTSLRYFTVYGPRQRPDMAIRRLTESAEFGTEFPLFGDGTQVRDFTYVDDVVQANVRAALSPTDPGLVANICGGSQVSMIDVIAMTGRLAGRPANVVQRGVERGDVRRTGGDSALAEKVLGWAPETSLEDGMGLAIEWLRRRSHHL